MRRRMSEHRSRGKGGLSEALCGAGVTRETVFEFADEMRVGLRGTVRRVWGRRGVKVRQRVQTVYEWIYLFCVVDGRRGRLTWETAVELDRLDEVCVYSRGGQRTEAWDRGGGAGVGWCAWTPGPAGGGGGTADGGAARVQS